LRSAIIVCLISALSCQAQQVSGPVSGLQPPGGLKIVVVQGEGAQNNIRSRTATPLVVEVRDDSDKPIEQAEVTFMLPSYGPGGVFNGWMRNQLARTNAQGRAQSQGFTPNEEEGRFNIRVTATSGTKTTNAVIAQSNVAGGRGEQLKSSRKKMWTIVAVVGAAALIGGIVAATRGGDSSSGSAAVSVPISITPGPITVGGPR
jgi:hypothetical protein